MSLYNFDAARDEKQRAHMQDLEARRVCVFCPEHIHNENGDTVIDETTNWIVKHNSYPYKSSKLHILLIPKRHIFELTELNQKEHSEYFGLLAMCKRKFKLDSYAIAIRSGDMRRNGGSIEHLHAHLIVGDTSDPNHEPIRVKVSSKPA